MRQSIKRGRVGVFNQSFKSKHCDDILKYLSKELCVKGYVYDFLEAYLNYKIKHFKIVEKDYEIQINDYRDEDVDPKLKYINEKLSNLSLHRIIKRIELTHLLWDFDALLVYIHLLCGIADQYIQESKLAMFLHQI